MYASSLGYRPEIGEGYSGQRRKDFRTNPGRRNGSGMCGEARRSEWRCDRRSIARQRRKEKKRSLGWAVQNGHGRATVALLSKGADPNYRDNDGYTMLHRAATHGHAHIASVLIAHKADINAQETASTLGWTPLHTAASSGHLEVAKVLLTHGADIHSNVNSTPLHVAIKYRSLDIAELLIAHGADVNALDWAQYTPLHQAAGSGKAHLARLMVEKGANIHARCGGYGRTPLHDAADEGCLEIVELLLVRGADVNARDKWRKDTPLHLAIYEGHAKVAKVLLMHGADVHSKNERGWTPMSMAEEPRHKGAFSFINRNGKTR